MITTVQIGQQVPDVLHNSKIIPIETQVSYGRDSYAHSRPMVWKMSGRDNRYMASDYLNYPLTLRSLSSGDEALEVPLVSETEFRWRLRDAALAAAERSGVDRRPVKTMCREFGAAEPYLHVGQVVSNAEDIKTLPAGTVIYHGHPEDLNVFQVWEVREDNYAMKSLLGHDSSSRGSGVPVTIYSIPGAVEPRYEPAATEAQLNRIALRAWRVGKTFKRKHSWCSTFENTLVALGITESALKLGPDELKGPGDEVDKEGASRLPEGTLLVWTWQNRHAMAVYVRDNKARNAARCRKVWGWQDDGENSHDRMVIVETPEEPMSWNVLGTYVQHMPGDTVVHWGRNETLKLEAMHIDTYGAYSIASFPAVER